ncbi:MAG TPA: hypothetical protein VLM11_21100 [Streptosporangiaceae bacterium]|nr:hypothetical protein [Streptosporangiaceae bacterium]
MLASTSSAASSHNDGGQGNGCHLGNGIKHVVQIGFDNTHFFRDNPNVPSDLQLMPNLLNFFTSNGTFLSNSHTPLIAHTATDLLTTATGLYGDRQGSVSNNSFRTYNADGTTDPATAFTYWTDPIDDTARTANAGHDTNPNMVYSPVPPSTASSPVSPSTVTPAPWVPYTRAGCNVGEVATANQELENPTFDIPKFFGANSPEAQQVAADPDFFKDNETADYVGLGVHCAQSSSFCADAQAVKFNQTTASSTAVPDLLPSEPGGYNGFQALFGARYLASQLGGGIPSLSHDGVPVTNAAGNLTDLFGNQLDGAFTSRPGFPGYGDINAAQSLAYAADMLERGVPVVNVYISDLHGNHGLPNSPQVPTMGTDCASAPGALGSGSQCYIDQAKYYNDAFGVFFKRLAADGITPQNTAFVVSSDEGDHQAGANVGRALAPSPAGCDGVTVPCTYTAANFGEITVNATALLASETGNTTPFTMQNDTSAQFYLTGNPGPTDPTVRTFEHSVASLTNPLNPYSGTANEPIANYLANPVEEAILHTVNADAARTPTLTMFAKPDYFLQAQALGFPCTGQVICQNNGFAWDHGDYAAEINTNYVGFVGPGVQQLGVDGPSASQGPSSAGANSGQTVVADNHFPGPWVDETDIRPTMLYLAGLQDDYQHDGRVISQILTSPNSALSDPGVTSLGACYKQLNSSVGDFGAATIVASTNAIESTSAGDGTFTRVERQLRGLEIARDRLAGVIKAELEAAAFRDKPIIAPGVQALACQGLIHVAQEVASSS